MKTGKYLFGLAFVISGVVRADGQTEWGQAPNGEFWNVAAKRFVFAPAFAFKEIKGAAKYSFEVLDDFHCVHRFEAQKPTVSLDVVWDKLPVGYVTVCVRGIGADGGPLGESGRRTFWKKAAFTGRYEPAKRSYALARNKVFDYFLGLPQTRFLAEHGRPDPTYPLNGYPSKMLSSEIQSLVTDGSHTEVLAFVNLDRSVVVMMANKEAAPKTVRISEGEKAYGVTLPASSVATLRF